jgi:hypothetical protein
MATKPDWAASVGVVVSATAIGGVIGAVVSRRDARDAREPVSAAAQDAAAQDAVADPAVRSMRGMPGQPRRSASVDRRKEASK